MKISQTFKSVLSGREFFLRDHRVLGETVLPGVAYLEMARVAALSGGDAQVLGLRNVVWLTPMVVNRPDYEIRINTSSDSGKMYYDVCSSGVLNRSPEIVHSRGEIVVAAQGHVAGSAPRLDLREIEARCPSIWRGSELYSFFELQGLQYGASFRCIDEMVRNEDEVLAKFSLPEAAGDHSELLGIHPGVADGALQATAGLLITDPQLTGKNIYLPFSLKEVTLYERTPEAGYIYARLSAGTSRRNSVLKFDLEIMDEAGKVCVSIKEFASRLYHGPVIEGSKDPETEGADLLYGRLVWERQITAPTFEDRSISASARAGALVMLVGIRSDIADLVAAQMDSVRVDPTCEPQRSSVGDEILETFLRVFEQIKGILKVRPKPYRRLVLLVSADQEVYRYAPLAGLIKSLRLEHRDIQAKLVLVSAALSPEANLAILNNEMEAGFDEVEVRYDQDGGREIRKFIEIDLKASIPPSAGDGSLPPLRSGGVYWITGGMGGLGQIFAAYLAGRGNVTLILTGRSPLTEENREWMEALRIAGANVEYFPADVSKRDQVKEVIDEIKERHGGITGI
ncbi:MAG TPA: SDR family NAD(P)-dependent oxidoreductase, partial [Blastocatellia bacterium]|nr:SDR family NAD(P)-dependent oxidoreductase [Blastocatellia bacterium]